MVIYYVLFGGDHIYIDCTDDMHGGVEDWADSGMIFLSKDHADKKAAYLNNSGWVDEIISVRRFSEIKEQT